MTVHRVRFAKDIVADYVPSRRSRSRKVLIVAAGMPSGPSKVSLLEAWAARGYHAFHFRYRGSWESGGTFLDKEPTKDLLDVVKGVYKPFVSIWTEELIHLDPRDVYVIGSSFGGPAALLATKDKRISAVVALSAVVDWTHPSKEEPHDWFYAKMRDACGMAYRFTKRHWNKLQDGFFYNPLSRPDEINGSKCLFIHAKDDQVASIGPVERLVALVDADTAFIPKGGHLGTRALAELGLDEEVHAHFMAHRSA